MVFCFIPLYIFTSLLIKTKKHEYMEANLKRINEDFERTSILVKLEQSHAMSSVMLYALNYEYKFINKVWKDNDFLINHLTNKWHDTQSRYNSNTEGFVMFYANLDNWNKAILNNYILNR